MDHMVRKDQKEIKFIKRQDSEHPYCTNWPMTNEEMNEIEICVSCGTETSYKKGDDITYRYGYIEGAGQLCFKCSQTRKMHKTGNYGDSEWSRYG